MSKKTFPDKFENKKVVELELSSDHEHSSFSNEKPQILYPPFYPFRISSPHDSFKPSPPVSTVVKEYHSPFLSNKLVRAFSGLEEAHQNYFLTQC